MKERKKNSHTTKTHTTNLNNIKLEIIKKIGGKINKFKEEDCDIRLHSKVRVATNYKFSATTQFGRLQTLIQYLSNSEGDN